MPMVVIDEENLRKNLAANMRYLRLRNSPRISQTMLARKIGTTQKSISNYELAYCLPPAHVLAALAECFGLTMDELMAERVPKKISNYTQKEGTNNE